MIPISQANKHRVLFQICLCYVVRLQFRLQLFTIKHKLARNIFTDEGSSGMQRTSALIGLASVVATALVAGPASALTAYSPTGHLNIIARPFNMQEDR